MHSGIFIFAFRKSPEECGDLGLALRSALGSSSLPQDCARDFDFIFRPKPEWTTLAASAPVNEIREVVRNDLESTSHKHFATKIGNKILALALLPQKPNSLSKKVISVLKDGSNQCSGQHPSLVWLHFIGHAEAEFLKLAHFSQKGDGAGLNAIVAKALHPRASSTDRSHVHTIRFSAEAAEVTQKPVLDSELLLRKAGSLSGPCYDVPNPFCRFKEEIDF